MLSPPHRRVVTTSSVWIVRSSFFFLTNENLSCFCVFFFLFLCVFLLFHVSGVMMDTGWGWGTTRPMTPSCRSIGRPWHCRSPLTNGCFQMVAPPPQTGWHKLWFKSYLLTICFSQNVFGIITFDFYLKCVAAGCFYVCFLSLFSTYAACLCFFFVLFFPLFVALLLFQSLQ